MMLSIIIPTCNRPDELAVCLSALEAQIAAVGPAEVLVMDDGSDPMSREMIEAKFPWAQWHAGPRRGPAANRNAGVNHAVGAWILFLDDDCIPRAGYLQAYAAAILDDASGRALVGATISAEVRPSLLWEAPHNPRGEVLISCNFAIPRQLFDHLGGFDERFPMAAFEDTDFECRVRTAGIPVQFLSEAAVDHPLRRVPGARKLAGRWEARVISTLDLGASPWQVAWRLPQHVFKVIVSRFRGQPWNDDTLKALARFSQEFAWLLLLLPGWLRDHALERRSPFWASQVAQGRAPARFGL